MKNWYLGKDNYRNWPETDLGEPVAPAFLQHISGPVNMELTLSLLDAYGIPTVCEYPNNGLFGKLILGFPAAGIDIFVPESMLEEARDILSAQAYEEEET